MCTSQDRRDRRVGGCASSLRQSSLRFRRYIFTQASLKAHLAQAAKTKALLQQSLAGEEGVDRARWENEAEGGSGGLEAMADKYASTRGDH